MYPRISFCYIHNLDLQSLFLSLHQTILNDKHLFMFVLAYASLTLFLLYFELSILFFFDLILFKIQDYIDDYNVNKGLYLLGCHYHGFEGFYGNHQFSKNGP